MNFKPKVTLGLCVKNIETTVSLTMKSILSQDFPAELMELIVVDGCSKDKTLRIIRNFLTNSNMKCRFFSENRGLGFARQMVVDNALGEYVIWVDGDMVLPRDHTEKQIAFMDKNPRVAIGRAKYGILRDVGPVAYLENIPFVVESARHDGDIPLGICGTEGAIYRVKALRQVGGFDANIEGAAEDTDVARRILAAGWSARKTQAVFYELCRDTWKSLWDEYFWWGRGGHYSFHKFRNVRLLIETLPLAGFLSGFLRFPAAYKMTNRKLMILLPFHYAFKRTAFLVGFSKAHFDGYGHSRTK